MVRTLSRQLHFSAVVLQIYNVCFVFDDDIMIIRDIINDNNNDVYSTDTYVEIQNENVFIKYCREEASEKHNNSTSHLLSRYRFILEN